MKSSLRNIFWRNRGYSNGYQRISRGLMLSNNRFNSLSSVRISENRAEDVKWLIGLSAISASLLSLGYSKDSENEAIGNMNTEVNKWKSMLDNTCPSVVSVHMNFPRAFEERSEGCSQATGFIVDAENGIILTNRHVAGTGPVNMEALFINGEKIQVKPIYRDPVHDFAFIKYNPEDLKYLSPKAIKLSPEKAFIGQEIRVIGNNAGEKLTISSGTLARLDRNAPNYGKRTYNDFNTFYLQSASSTTGGSSGSPVVNIEGECIGLNAGGKVGASNAFYLPLERVKRALTEIQSNNFSIQRGTIQTTFRLKSYADLRYFGLPPEIEHETRKALINKYGSSTSRTYGLLTVQKLVPKGPGAVSGLRPGDILYKLDDKLICNFVDLENILDTNTYSTLPIEVIRQGKIHKYTINIDNLHEISPHYYYETNGSIIHEIGYQLARNANISINDIGVFISRAGPSFSAAGIASKTLILEVNGVKTPNLMKFIEVYSQIKSGEKMNLKVCLANREKSSRIISVDVNNNWHDQVFCVRNGEEWVQYRNEELKKLMKSYTKVYDSPAKREDTSSVLNEKVTQLYPITHSSDKVSEELAKKLGNAFVEVKFSASHKLDGNSDQSFLGGGIVVDTENGYVIADRDSVTSCFGVLKLNFGNFIEIPADIEYFHPIYNMVLLKYNPKHPSLQQLEIPSIKLTREVPKDKIYFIGLNWKNPSDFGPCLDVSKGHYKLHKSEQPRNPVPPKFKGTQFDHIGFSKTSESLDTNGIYCNKEGKILGFQTCFPINPEKKRREFWWGLPSDVILEFIEGFKSENKELKFNELGVTLRYLSLRKAKELGIADEYLDKAIQYSQQSNTFVPPVVVAIKNTWSGLEAEKVLRNDDILLEVDNQAYFSYQDIHKAIQGKDRVKVKILRNKEKLEYELSTVKLGNDETSRFIQWQGCNLQNIHKSAIQQGLSNTETAIYISSRKYGSPAEKYGLYPTMRVTEVDGKKVHNINEFLDCVKTKEHNSYVVIRTLDLQNVENLIHLKVDNQFFPTIIADKTNEQAEILTATSS